MIGVAVASLQSQMEQTKLTIAQLSFAIYAELDEYVDDDDL